MSVTAVDRYPLLTALHANRQANGSTDGSSGAAVAKAYHRTRNAHAMAAVLHPGITPERAVAFTAGQRRTVAQAADLRDQRNVSDVCWAGVVALLEAWS